MDGLTTIREYAKDNKIPIIQEDFQSFLEVLLTISKPKRVLEIGTAIGYSAIFMASVLGKEIQLDTIEINSDLVEIAWNNIKRTGCESCIRIMEGDALEILPLLSGEYDFIFMDAAKSKYIDFLPHCVNLLKNEGIIVADNVLYKGMTNGPDFVRHKQRTAVTGLRKFVNEVQNHPELKTVLIDIGDGITISVKCKDRIKNVKS